MTAFDAVTFDFWNTLLHADLARTRANRIEGWLEVFERRGVDIGPEVLDGVFDRVSEIFDAAWSDNRQFVLTDALGATFELLADVDDPTRTELADVWRERLESAEITATDGIAEVLAALAGSDVRIGIICDVGLTPSTTLRRYLERLGLLDAFDHWSFSDEVGHYKPDGRIFAHALAGLGDVSPDRAVHIGDLRRTDVAGARSSGLTAVRYRGAFDDPHRADLPEGHHVIDHHHQLLEILLED